MAVDKLVDSSQLNSDLTLVADAIRSKTGGSALLAFPSEYVLAINGITGGEYNVISEIQQDGTQKIIITDAGSGGGGGQQTKSVSYTPSETAQSETVVPDSGYNGLSSVSVSVGAISSSYVGSGITRRTSTDLSASGGTVTAPAGYYASSVSKAVSSMTLPTSAASSAASGYTSKATIGRSTSNQYINIPTGYNNSAAYYTVSAVANGSATTPATTVTANPSISVSSGGLITATASATKSVTPTVSAGYVSSGTAGTITVSGSNTSQLTVQTAQTIHPSTTDQTITSGKYLTGTQTVKAVTVSGLSASNILSGVTVKIGDSTDDDCVTSVSGSVTFQTIYSGSSAPSSSQGVNGDIYIQM